MEFLAPYNKPEAVSGLAEFSHIWVQFLFHQNRQLSWQPLVRPPRLGGNRRVGVFATRSPFRPNPIGLSVVKLESVQASTDQVSLQLSGVDLLDGTPVLDIKPYIGYSDSVPEARCGFAQNPPKSVFRVDFSPLALQQLAARPEGGMLKQLIKSLLETDPRPAYAGDQAQDRCYGFRLFDFDLRWRVTGGVAEVLELAKI